MRAAAAVLLIAASVCVGMLLRDGLHQRVRLCSQICVFLRQVRLRARLHEPLGMQIGVLSESCELEALTFLSDCAVRCRQGQPLPLAWTNAVETFLRTHKIPRAQSEMLSQCIPALSDADGQRVDGLLELYEARAAQMLESAEQTDAAVGSLCVRLCAAAGLLLGILIL